MGIYENGRLTMGGTFDDMMAQATGQVPSGGYDPSSGGFASGTPAAPSLALAGKQVGRVRVGEGTTSLSLCDSAASALSRGSPAAAGLVSQCAARRDADIMAGRFVVDAYTTDDPALRVALDRAGTALLARDTALAAAHASLPAGLQRGFRMGAAVRAGGGDPNYVNYFLRGNARHTELAQGFALGLGGAGDLVQGGNVQGGGAGAGAEAGGIPKPVIIGGVVVGVAALGLLAYKFLG